uniref:Glyco_hydro_38N domain-containing protein n=1 Tax=Rhodnius prolixus TaxID=13249 RepID=T1HA70_RHOPR
MNIAVIAEAQKLVMLNGLNALSFRTVQYRFQNFRQINIENTIRSGPPLDPIVLKEAIEVNSRNNLGRRTKSMPEGCHQVKPDKLNIHLIPHTHDDAGWLKTVDQYYYGGHQRHAPFGVQYIIDSVLAELEVNETRRFTYVESAFLWRWWNDRGEYHREKLRKLVKQGRLQITHGGWVMSDEATTHYTALIHQMSFGLKFIQETFGDCSFPNVAWQVDPFGHSSEVGLQFADMGYDAVFFGRIDRDDYNRRLDDRTLEMVWRPDPEIGPDGDLFTSILYNLYMPPDGFCFDVFCNDEPIMDNPNMHGNNVKRRVYLYTGFNSINFSPRKLSMKISGFTSKILALQPQDF